MIAPRRILFALGLAAFHLGGPAVAANGHQLAEQCLRQIRENRHTPFVDPRECSDAIASGDLDDETLALVLYSRGAILMQRGHPEAGARDFAQAALLNPDPAFVLFMRGMLRLVADDPMTAVAEWNRALAQRDHPAIRLQRGRALLMLGRPDAALEDFHHVLDAWPTSSEACVGRGRALLALGRPDESLADFDRVVAKFPGDTEALMYRATARFDKGDRVAAKVDAERVAGLHPRNALFSARLLFAEQDWAGATAAFMKADPYLTLPEQRHVYLWDAVAQRRRKAEPAVSGVPQVFDPAKADMWPMTAMRFVIRAQYPSMDYFPRFARVTEAQVLASANDPDSGVAARQRVQAAFYMGQIYLGTNQPADAARLFRQFIDPAQFDSWEYRINLLELARLRKLQR